jgi:hypothetical protein
MKYLNTAAVTASLAAVAVLSGCAVYPADTVYSDGPGYYRGVAPTYYDPAPYGPYYGAPPVYYGPGPVIINRGGNRGGWDQDRRGDRDRWDRDRNGRDGRDGRPGRRPPQAQPPVAQPSPRPPPSQGRPPRGPSAQGGPDDLPFPGMGGRVRRND